MGCLDQKSDEKAPVMAQCESVQLLTIFGNEGKVSALERPEEVLFLPLDSKDGRSYWSQGVFLR